MPSIPFDFTLSRGFRNLVNFIAALPEKHLQVQHFVLNQQHLAHVTLEISLQNFPWWTSLDCWGQQSGFSGFFLSTVELQSCFNFCCIAKWFKYIYIKCIYVYVYIYILFHILFRYGLLQNIEYSCPCCTVHLIVYTFYV